MKAESITKTLWRVSDGRCSGFIRSVAGGMFLAAIEGYEYVTEDFETALAFIRNRLLTFRSRWHEVEQ